MSKQNFRQYLSYYYYLQRLASSMIIAFIAIRENFIIVEVINQKLSFIIIIAINKYYCCYIASFLGLIIIIMSCFKIIIVNYYCLLYTKNFMDCSNQDDLCYFMFIQKTLMSKIKSLEFSWMFNQKCFELYYCYSTFLIHYVIEVKIIKAYSHLISNYFHIIIDLIVITKLIMFLG